MIDIGGTPKRIGLALSGGGFRAAAFHLGALGALARNGLLSKIDLLTCVSGGSIAGAFVAAHWKSGGGLELLRRFLGTESLAVSAVLRGLVSPFETRLDALAASYDDKLYGRRTFGDLADGPRLYVNATSLATGNGWFFVTGGGGDVVMGDHEMGTVDASRFSVARAVAASSSFPPVFPPLRLEKDSLPPGCPLEYVTLSDGGVYDNLGINPLLRARNQLDYVIVSDGGKPFENDTTPTEMAIMVLYRMLAVAMEQVRGLQFARLELAAKGGGPKPIWFSIDSEEGSALSDDARHACAVSTNLAALSDETLALLERHGGALLEARLRRYAPELLGGGQ